MLDKKHRETPYSVFQEILPFRQYLYQTYWRRTKVVLDLENQ